MKLYTLLGKDRLEIWVDDGVRVYKLLEMEVRNGTVDARRVEEAISEISYQYLEDLEFVDQDESEPC